MKTLNRKQPFDTCHGEDEHGRAYFQDGVYFDLDDNEVVVEGEEPKAKAKAKAKAA